MEKDQFIKSEAVQGLSTELSGSVLTLEMVEEMIIDIAGCFWTTMTIIDPNKGPIWAGLE